jgi:hypothetical protein
MYSAEPVGLQKLLLLSLFASLLIPIAKGQTVTQSGRPDMLTVVNSRQTDIPIERARVLLLTACRVVAEEFHKRPEDLDLRMKLILGEPHERVSVDDSGGMTLYLERWNETKFVDGIITGAMQLLMPLDTRKHVFTEILRRTDKIAPVTANQLRVPTTNSPLPRRSLVPDCISAVNNGPCSWPNRLPDR